MDMTLLWTLQMRTSQITRGVFLRNIENTCRLPDWENGLCLFSSFFFPREGDPLTVSLAKTF